MQKYRATMTIIIEAPTLSDAGKALGLDNIEFDADTDNTKVVRIDLTIGEEE